MKYILKTKLLSASLLGLILGVSACTGDFESINKDPRLPDDKMLALDGTLNGAYIPDLQKRAIPAQITGGTDEVNDYQVICNLQPDSWMGYLAPREAKWPGKNLTQFYFDTGWTNGTFGAGVTKIFSPWLQLKKLNYDVANKNLEIWSIAQISKIMGFHRSVDKYGALPYTGIGSGSFVSEYDSAESIYHSFFSELEEAVKILYAYGLQGKPVKKASDIIYEGDASKWAKLGNSLMLRLAMRVRYVDPQLSKTWAEKALHHPAGLIETPEDNAFIKDKGGVVLTNPLYVVAGSYNDTRMGATIQSYLKGYNDPRLSVYFEGDLDIAVPPAIPQTGSEYNGAAKPKVGERDKLDWFRCSEVSFLKAEAALAGYNVTGSAKSHYEEGIRRSFVENGISESQLTSYLNTSKRPAAFQDKIIPKYSAEAPSSLTTAWDDSAPEEVKLERIMIQKYLALYPDGTEAWSEWRRTGYPRLIPANTNISNFGVVTSDGHKDGVRCIPYPQSELTQNAENVRKAIDTYRGGNNAANVNVWWDVKVKN